MVHDLHKYRQAKKTLAQYVPHFNKLSEFSNYLFSNLHLPGTFDMLEEVESQKIDYYMQIIECKRILSSKASNTQFKPKLILTGRVDSEIKK